MEPGIQFWCEVLGLWRRLGPTWQHTTVSHGDPLGQQHPPALCPPNLPTPAGRDKSSQATLLHLAAIPWWLRWQHQARHKLSTLIPPTPHLGFAPTVDKGADGVVGASAAHIEVGPVPGLDQADEVATLPLGSREVGGNCSMAGERKTPFPLPLSTSAMVGTMESSPLAQGRS